MTAQSWFKFYPSDWCGDTGVRSCSLAARGLWFELICIMHEATPYGHLLINGKPPSYYRIAQLVGTDRKQVQRLMAHLENRGVFSVTSRGILYSRRMVRDKLKSEQGQAFAKMRWGAEPNAPEARKKERGPTEESKRRKQVPVTKARHRWENDLLKQGTEYYAEMMDALAAHPELIERATKAEMLRPGSGAGATAVVIGLKRLREVAS